MNAIDLLNQSQTDFVSNSALGTSETIEYTHSSGKVVYDLRAFVELGEFNDSLPDDKKVNSIAISNVVLSKTPTKTDSFVYEGISYKVRHWEGSGLYQIYAENSKRNRVSSTASR